MDGNDPWSYLSEGLERWALTQDTRRRLDGVAGDRLDVIVQLDRFGYERHEVAPREAARVDDFQPVLAARVGDVDPEIDPLRQALQDFEVELGMRSPETTPVSQTAKDLGPATEKLTN